jgi:hypothetical protein
MEVRKMIDFYFILKLFLLNIYNLNFLQFKNN